MNERMTSRKKQALQTRESIFQSAVRLFDEHGYDNVTIEDITSRAGVAKGSFYTYFKSKSDIVIEEFHSIDDFYRSYRSKLGTIESALERIQEFTNAQLHYVRDNVGLKLLKLLYVNNIQNPDVKNILIDPERYLNTLVQEIIAYGQEKGTFRRDLDARQLASLFNRSLRSVFLDWAVSDGSFDLVQEGLNFFTVVLLPFLKA